MHSNWSEQDVIVNGHPLHYARGGQGAPLVLAHGFSDNGFCWLPIANELRADHDVILPDSIGHGHSARVPSGGKVDRVGDLGGLITALGLAHPVVGGHSMGAGNASQLEMRFPGLAGALILEDPAWRELTADLERRRGPHPFQERLLHQSSLSVEQLMAECRAEHPTWPEAELPAWAESKKQFDLNTFTLQNDNLTPWKEVANAIHCPTLLIIADVEKGALVTPEVARQAAELNPHIQVVHISGAGHNIRRENPADYMAAVRAFLKSL